jgi:hypothetical protein
VRNWRLTEATVGAPPHDAGALLPPGSALRERPMPRDADLLSDMSREMLRVARRPRVPAPPPAANGSNGNGNGNGHGGGKDGAAEENGAADEDLARAEKRKGVPRGFPVRRWSQMSKGYDEPEREYLAKRRRGLPPMHDGFNPIAGPVASVLPGGVAQAGAGGGQQFRSLKVRRVDAAGRAHVYDVMAPVGAVVEGEISAEEAARITAAPGGAASASGAGAAVAVVEPPAAPGTIIEGVGVVNAEGVVIAQPTPKRKPLPPRRKPKKGGPGRKPQQPQVPQQPQQPAGAPGAAPENGTAGGAPAGEQFGAAPPADGGVANGGAAEGAAPAAQGAEADGSAGGDVDTPMHDAHEGDDEDEDEGSGEEEGSSHMMDEDDDEHHGDGGGASAGSTPGGAQSSAHFSDDAHASQTPDNAQHTPGFVGSSLKMEIKLEPEPGQADGALDDGMDGHDVHLGMMDNEPLADILAPPAHDEHYGDADMKMDDPFAHESDHALMAQVPEFTMAGVKDDMDALTDDRKDEDAFFAAAVDDGSHAMLTDSAPMGDDALGGTALSFPAMSHLDEEPTLQTPDDMSASAADISSFAEQPLLQFDGITSISLQRIGLTSVPEHPQLPGLTTTGVFEDALPAAGDALPAMGDGAEAKEESFSLLDSLEAHLNASPAADAAAFPDSVSAEKSSG